MIESLKIGRQVKQVKLRHLSEIALASLDEDKYFKDNG
jgi:hypothetical protein